MRNRIFTALLILLGVLSAGAQSPPVPEHPRAMELERSLQKEIQSMLHDMLLEKPFHVTVQVTPLRRGTAGATKESLPYYDTTEEIRDEWDDPAKSEFELMGRVTRITVKVAVPKGLSDAETADIKAAVIGQIPFVEGRDAIEITAKEFPGLREQSVSPWAIGGFATVCLCFIGLGGISLLSSRRLARAIQNIKIETSEGAGSSAPLPPPAGFSPGERASGGGQGGFTDGADIQFQDTLKMLEMTTGVLKTIYSSAAFPTLEDMVLFEKFATDHPASTGALFAEFPPAVRERVFALTSSASWLETLTQPGKIDSASFSLLSRLSRIDRTNKDAAWEQLLVACWRLGDSLPEFLRKIDNADAVTILKALPQSIGLKVARELMPGQWASVLRPGPTVVLAPEKLASFRDQINANYPMRSVAVLEQYKKDLELALFLRTADPQTEKEVYGALPANSTLFKLRSPFASVLDAETARLKTFAEKVSIEDWAMALMNLNKAERGKLEVVFSERQRFRLAELLRSYDRANVPADTIGRTRERIAALFRDFTAAAGAAAAPGEQTATPDRSTVEAA